MTIFVGCLVPYPTRVWVMKTWEAGGAVVVKIIAHVSFTIRGFDIAYAIR
jgi:hypothetical protein